MSSDSRITPTPMHVEVRVQEADFDIGAEWQRLRERRGGEVGAMASFVGLVRDRRAQDAVNGLYLEHYPGMTERSIEQIVDEAGRRWPLLDVVVVHRVGLLAPRAQIVFVQATSGHRDAAFAGAEFIMDYLKTDAVFWKREDRASGADWIESTQGDRERRDHWVPNSD